MCVCVCPYSSSKAWHMHRLTRMYAYAISRFRTRSSSSEIMILCLPDNFSLYSFRSREEKSSPICVFLLAGWQQTIHAQKRQKNVFVLLHSPSISSNIIITVIILSMDFEVIGSPAPPMAHCLAKIGWLCKQRRKWNDCCCSFGLLDI